VRLLKGRWIAEGRRLGRRGWGKATWGGGKAAWGMRLRGSRELRTAKKRRLAGRESGVGRGRRREEGRSGFTRRMVTERRPLASHAPKM
jgi:hypothetical protein